MSCYFEDEFYDDCYYYESDKLVNMAYSKVANRMTKRKKYTWSERTFDASRDKKMNAKNIAIAKHVYNFVSTKENRLKEKLESDKKRIDQLYNDMLEQSYHDRFVSYSYYNEIYPYINYS